MQKTGRAAVWATTLTRTNASRASALLKPLMFWFTPRRKAQTRCTELHDCAVVTVRAQQVGQPSLPEGKYWPQVNFYSDRATEDYELRTAAGRKAAVAGDYLRYPYRCEAPV